MKVYITKVIFKKTPHSAPATNLAAPVTEPCDFHDLFREKNKRHHMGAKRMKRNDARLKHVN